MRKIAFFSLLVFFAFACGNQKKQAEVTDELPVQAEVVALSIDDLYEDAAGMVDKEVVIKGTVMHVCQQGGKRCFLMGSNEDINIRVEAGEKIGAFSQELMGSELEIVGILKEVKTEADAHNPGQEHGTGEAEHEEDEQTAKAHQIIAEAQEAAEVVYFVEGLKFKEL